MNSVLQSTIALTTLSSFLPAIWVFDAPVLAQTTPQPSFSPKPDQIESCELLVAGGGLAGAATAYEALLAGRTVCLTEITDWVGGQISAQGTSALDEAKKQRSIAYFPKGYNEFRDRIKKRYGTQNPGDCWVSLSCFLPKDAHAELWSQLKRAERKGRGKLKWFPNTVIKDLEVGADGKLIEGAIAIQHKPADGQPLNSRPLSQTLEEAYRYEDSVQFEKKIIKLEPKTLRKRDEQGKRVTVKDWYVVDTTETGELIAIADVPYRLGIDPRSYLNPSSASTTGDPYCTQGFTYTFAMERTAEPQPQVKPEFYDRYAAYYGYDKNPNLSAFDAVFTYRRIWAPGGPERQERTPRFGVGLPQPGDISMQNWVWGNDYRPGHESDNLVYTREQLQQSDQLSPGGWLGGLRTETLQAGEEQSLGFYHWLTSGITNSQGDAALKKPFPNHKLLTGKESPMGTFHGLSKYPYIREGRRIIGRPSYAHKDGFTVSEIDISRQDFRADYYQENLPPRMYRSLWNALAGLEAIAAVTGEVPTDKVMRRSRSTIYPDAVGIAQYAIDFHPCMAESPSEKPGNIERPGARQGHGQAYPAQIPLRAMIPQKLDNLLVAGKSIATSHIAAAAYRVHSFEWSAGAAAGTAIDLALETGTRPYEMVDNFPKDEPLLRQLQMRLQANGNPIAFPNTTIFNEEWEDWRVW